MDTFSLNDYSFLTNSIRISLFRFLFIGSLIES